MAEASDEQWLPAWFGDDYFTTAPALSARVFRPCGIEFGSSERVREGFAWSPQSAAT